MSGHWFLSDRYLLRTNPDGSRQISWRMWVLVWVIPVLFALATVWLSLVVLWKQSTYAQTVSEVTHVYEWENDAPQMFYPGDKVYSPRFRYTWSDETMTEATAGTSHTNWNFEIGSLHPIRYNPSTKDDVVLFGPSEWWVVRAIGWIGAVTFIPSLIGSMLLVAWRRRGARTG